MAQVPYSPVPDVTSTYAPAPEAHINSPEAAFGGATAQAWSTLGKVSEQASGEIYQRAMAMQNLKNEADSRRKAVDFERDSGQLFADFKTQLGANAGPEAYASFQKNLVDLREKYRSDLDNPMAQSRYDADSYNLMGRLFMNGAAHSAEQLKQYSVSTNKAAIESASNAVQVNPADEKGYQAGLGIAEKNAREMAAAHGLSPEDTEQQVAIARSNVTMGRISAMARTDVIGAKKLFDEALSKGDLRGEAITSLQGMLQTKENTVGSKMVVDHTRDGVNMAMGQGVVDMARAKDAIANGIESGGNYGAVGIKTKSGDQAYGKYQVMGANLPGWLEKSGLPAMSPQEFLKNPSAQEKVFETIFGGYMQKYGNFNEAAAKWFTGKSLSEGAKGSDVNGTTVPSYLAATNAQLYKTATITDKSNAVRAEATKIAPDNPVFADIASDRAVTQHTQEERLQKQQSSEDWNTVNQAILDGTGKGPMTLETLGQTSPEVAQALERVANDPKKMLQLQGILKKQAAADNTPTAERDSNYNKLVGQALVVDPEGFKHVQLDQENLTGEQRGELLKLQKQALSPGGIGQDPLVRKAITDPAIIQTARDIGAEPSNHEEWAKFTGALAEEIKFARASGKALTQADVQDMANKLVQVRAGTGWFGTNVGASREYEVPLHAIPEATRGAIQKKLTEKFQREPTNQEMERAYALKLYLDTQGAKVANR